MVMVEPVLASINQILANPVPIRPVLSHSSFRAISTAMHPQSFDAVYSRSQRAKGKQKASPDANWFTDSQWLNSKHCTKYPSPDSSEAPIRHCIQPYLRHPTRPSLAPSQPAITPSFRTPCRVHVRYASDSTQLATHDNMALPLRMLTQFINDTEPKVSLAHAWEAFQSLNEQGHWDTGSSTLAERVATYDTYTSLADRMLTEVEKILDAYGPTEEFREWMDCVKLLIDELGTHVKENSYGSRRRHSTLSARWFALRGDIPAALKAFETLQRAKTRKWFEKLELRMLYTLIQALHRQRGPARVLDFLVTEIKTVGDGILGVQFRGGAAEHESPMAVISKNEFFRLLELVTDILDKISFPASLLAHRKSRVSDRHQIDTAAILIMYLLQRRVPEDAIPVWDELHSQGLQLPIARTSVLIRGLAREKRFELANNLFSSINPSLEPTKETPTRILSTGLHLFSHHGDVERAEQYFEVQVARSGVELPAIGMLLHAYAVNGDAEGAVRVFSTYFPAYVPSQHSDDTPDATDDQFPPVDEPLDTTVENSELPHDPRPTVDLSQPEPNYDSASPTPTPNRRRPNVVHYSSVILAHGNARDFDGMNFWLNTMIKNGVPPDHHVYGILIESFAARGDVNTVAGLLNQMVDSGLQPSASVYTAIIDLLGRRRDPVAAEAMYKRAINEKITPDRHMIASLMHAHVEAGSFQGAIRAFDFLATSKNLHLKPRIGIFNILLKSYVLLGAPFELVLRVFRRIEKAGLRPTAHTYTTLMQSAILNRNMNVALDIFNDLDRFGERWETGLHAGVYPLTLLMSGYLRYGQKDKAKEVYDNMLDRGIQPTSMTYNNILRAYAEEGTDDSLQMAKDFVKSLMESNLEDKRWLDASRGLNSIYLPVMAQLARVRRPAEVEAYYQEVMNHGSEPSIQLLTVLLNAYRNVWAAEPMRQVWSQILRLAIRQYKIDGLFPPPPAGTPPRPDLQRQSNVLCVPLSIYIDGLSRACHHDEVAEVWAQVRSLGFAFDSHNWNHLIVVLVRAGQLERALQVIERVILPYRRQTWKLSRKRDTYPDSPLLFDDHPPLEEIDPFVVKEARAAAYSKHRYRVTRGGRHRWKRRRLAKAIKERPRDFAYPLHLLQQVNPQWNLWKVHHRVQGLLKAVIHHLESGRMIKPMTSPRGTWKNKAKGHQQREQAEALLERLRATCPDAMGMLKRRAERIRRTRATREYIRARRGEKSREKMRNTTEAIGSSAVGLEEEMDKDLDPYSQRHG